MDRLANEIRRKVMEMGSNHNGQYFDLRQEVADLADIVANLARRADLQDLADRECRPEPGAGRSTRLGHRKKKTTTKTNGPRRE